MDATGNDNRAARRNQRQRLLRGEERALYIDVEIFIELSLGDLAQRRCRASAGIGNKNIQPALLLLDGSEEMVEVVEIRDIAADGSDIAANLRSEQRPSPVGDSQ